MIGSARWAPGGPDTDESLLTESRATATSAIGAVRPALSCFHRSGGQRTEPPQTAALSPSTPQPAARPTAAAAPPAVPGGR